MNSTLGSVVVILGILMLVSCSQSDEYNPDVENAKIRAEEGLDSPVLKPTNDGFAISAPSDPGASYRILKIKKRSNGNLEVLSRRDGSLGTSFSRREINCGAYTYRYLGDGDTRKEAESNDPNPGKMTELTGTSASSDVANAACRKGAK